MDDPVAGLVGGIIPACAGSAAALTRTPPPCRDHPRVRGEHLVEVENEGGHKGSSPHARGAHSRSRRGRSPPGIIPACAGSTPRRWPRAVPWQDHPRMRGEHPTSTTSTTTASGSSPHARGARRRPRFRGTRDRIIPACAGSTDFSSDWGMRCWDHPRMRGEHRHHRRPRQSRRGSSPHARGAQGSNGREATNPGIIPACAGSTLKIVGFICHSRDHPRMRGEHPGIQPLSWNGAGSSPHARGVPVLLDNPRRNLGIIPACAGSTNGQGCSSCPDWDHPRMRGEHAPESDYVVVYMGSSPHARGALEELQGLAHHAGIIPACAGSTCRTARAPSRRRDHPRMRGEHMS